jgi:phage FluMu protein Com
VAETTYEEAKRCPKCREPGRDTGVTRRGPRGSVIHTIECANPRCKWFNTAYIIQTNPDGTIPPPTTDRDKSFRPLPPRSDAAVDEQMQRMLRDQQR